MIQKKVMILKTAIEDDADETSYQFDFKQLFHEPHQQFYLDHRPWSAFFFSSPLNQGSSETHAPLLHISNSIWSY